MKTLTLKVNNEDENFTGGDNSASEEVEGRSRECGAEPATLRS